MIFIIDEMFPLATARHLGEAGHEAYEPRGAGLPRDLDIVALARSAGAVIVTENYADFATAREVTVLFASKKRLAPCSAMAADLADRLRAWAEAHAEPAATIYWL